MKKISLVAALLLVASYLDGQTPTVSINGTVSANGSITGNGLNSSGGAAGQVSLTQGTAPAMIVSNSFVLVSPATISTAYQSVVPAAPLGGFWYGTLGATVSATPTVPSSGSQAGQVTGATGLSGGSGYAIAPVCTVVNTGSGSGTGATCTTSINGSGVVTAINVPTPNGSGYVQSTTAFQFSPQTSIQFAELGGDVTTSGSTSVQVTATHLTSALPVAQGGTGDVSLTAHGVLLGEGTAAITALSAPAAGTVLTGQGGSSDPSFGATPVLGVNASTTGQLGFANGNSSGATVTVQNNGAIAAYNFNLPTAAGTSGQPLLSAGGGSAAMTFGTLAVAGGGTGNVSLTAHGVLLGEGTSAITPLAAPASGTVLTGQGTGSDPSFGATPVLGVNASTTGQLGLANGNSSGATVTVQNNGATTAYNFNLPTAAGTAGQPLLSGGGLTGAMTWGSFTGTGSTTFVAGNTNFTSANSGNAVSIDANGNAQSSGIATSNLGQLNVAGTWTQPQTFNSSIAVNSLTLNGSGSHIQTHAANKDTSGTASISSSTSVAVSFTTNFSSSTHPACTASPESDSNGSFGSWWITYAGSSGSWTGFTIHVHSSATVNFDYICIGNPS
jgi:hypothetical protein